MMPRSVFSEVSFFSAKSFRGLKILLFNLQQTNLQQTKTRRAPSTTTPPTTPPTMAAMGKDFSSSLGVVSGTNGIGVVEITPINSEGSVSGAYEENCNRTNLSLKCHVEDTRAARDRNTCAARGRRRVHLASSFQDKCLTVLHHPHDQGTQCRHEAKTVQTGLTLNSDTRS